MFTICNCHAALSEGKPNKDGSQGADETTEKLGIADLLHGHCVLFDDSLAISPVKRKFDKGRLALVRTSFSTRPGVDPGINQRSEA